MHVIMGGQWLPVSLVIQVLPGWDGESRGALPSVLNGRQSMIRQTWNSFSSRAYPTPPLICLFSGTWPPLWSPSFPCVSPLLERCFLMHSLHPELGCWTQSTPCHPVQPIVGAQQICVQWVDWIKTQMCLDRRKELAKSTFQEPNHWWEFGSQFGGDSCLVKVPLDCATLFALKH